MPSKRESSPSLPKRSREKFVPFATRVTRVEDLAKAIKRPGIQVAGFESDFRIDDGVASHISKKGTTEAMMFDDTMKEVGTFLSKARTKTFLNHIKEMYSPAVRGYASTYLRAVEDMEKELEPAFDHTIATVKTVLDTTGFRSVSHVTSARSQHVTYWHPDFQSMGVLDDRLMLAIGRKGKMPEFARTRYGDAVEKYADGSVLLFTCGSNGAVHRSPLDEDDRLCDIFLIYK